MNFLLYEQAVFFFKCKSIKLSASFETNIKKSLTVNQPFSSYFSFLIINSLFQVQKIELHIFFSLQQLQQQQKKKR